MPMPFQSAFSCPIRQTKKGTEEVKRIARHTEWVFWLSAHEVSDGCPRAQTLLSLAWLLVSAVPRARQCHRLVWEAESSLGELLQESANEPYPELATHWELG